MTEKLAIDANLLVRNATRRLMMGVAEIAKFRVVIPATAAHVGKQVYRKVRAGGERKRIEYEMELEGRPEKGGEATDKLTQALDNAEAGFAQWLESEPLRNDAMIEIAASNDRTRQVASALLLAEVVEDPDDRRFGTGEDPQVLAEALEAGAQWVASDNLHTISVDAMERWLDKEQAMGHYQQVPRPFILRPDQAVETLLRTAEPHAMANPWDADTMHVALCAALCEANRPGVALRTQVWNLSRFADVTRKGGAPLTGGLTRRWVRKAMHRLTTQRHAEVTGGFSELTLKIQATAVAKTRAAEERRLTLERTPESDRTKTAPRPTGRASSHER